MTRTINPKPLDSRIWSGDRMKPLVRKRLLTSAKEFIGEHIFGMNDVIDIIVTGSMAGFYYDEKHSDIDLHIVVDADKIACDRELLRHYFDLSKFEWEEKRPHNIFGIEVEVYVQEHDQENVSDGVYSVLKGEWIQKPQSSGSFEICQEYINFKKKSVDKLLDYIDMVANRNPEHAQKLLENTGNRIWKMRRESLNDWGEFSYGNLIFKNLRNSGTLNRLKKMKVDVYEKSSSLGEES